jgi:hypothetical protein
MGIKTWQFTEQPAGFAPVVELKGHTAPIQVSGYPQQLQPTPHEARVEDSCFAPSLR